MKNFKEHPFTTGIGLILFVVGLALTYIKLFIETKEPVSWIICFVFMGAGFLSIISRDKFSDVLITFLTLGGNRLLGK